STNAPSNRLGESGNMCNGTLTHRWRPGRDVSISTGGGRSEGYVLCNDSWLVRRRVSALSTQATPPLRRISLARSPVYRLIVLRSAVSDGYDSSMAIVSTVQPVLSR